MSKVLSAHALSVDGCITGRDPGPRRGLGDGSVLRLGLRRGHAQPGVRWLQAVRAHARLFGGGRTFLQALPEHVHLRPSKLSRRKESPTPRTRSHDDSLTGSPGPIGHPMHGMTHPHDSR
jgi:hypothetical protein